MKRTRRAALALIVGSSGTLAVETFGFSSARTDRGVRVAAVDDANAYLGLTEDGIEESGHLFDGGSRRPPARFDLVNQLPEPLTVTLTVDPFRFRSADGTEIDGDRFVVGDDNGDSNEGLKPGERIDDVRIGLPANPSEFAIGETISGTLSVDAQGADTRIEAERELAIAVPDVAVETAEPDMSRSRTGFEHEWLLTGVDTDGAELERLRFEYGEVPAAGALDRTAPDDQSVSIAIDGGKYSGSIVRRGRTTLVVALQPPIAVETATVEVALTNTGPPASTGGGRGERSGATVELDTGTVSERVEARWRSD